MKTVAEYQAECDAVDEEIERVRKKYKDEQSNIQAKEEAEIKILREKHAAIFQLGLDAGTKS